MLEYSDVLMAEIEKRFMNEELLMYSKILNKMYDVNDTDDMLWKVLNNVFENRIEDLILKYSKYMVANEIINKMLLKYFPGERTIKYEFVKKIKDHKNQVTLFEMYVDSSRADICRINGESIAYEIKTEIDTLDRLEKQIQDYFKVFEKVYIVTCDKHLHKVVDSVPQKCGIIKYRNYQGKYVFHYYRKAIKNLDIDKYAQINNLSSKDLMWILRKLKVKEFSNKKADRQKILLERYDAKTINYMFKQAIKNKYKRKWDFLYKRFNDIYPIDIQSLFKIPVDPEIIYYKNYNY